MLKMCLKGWDARAQMTVSHVTGDVYSSCSQTAENARLYRDVVCAMLYRRAIDGIDG